jgi:energy-coupling factor transporter ATP-binding protein EcfA2
MKVTSLSVSNLLSFDEFELAFDEGLTVIVGPNGAGKSNVTRALDLAAKLVDWCDERTRSGAAPPTPADAVVASYVQAKHDRSLPSDPMQVRLGIALTTSRERERLVAFIRAAVLGRLCEENPTNVQVRMAQLSPWVGRAIDDRKLTPLFTGTLAFHHPGYEGGYWDCRYEFDLNGARYDWALYAPGSLASIFPHGTAADAIPSETRVWEALFGQPTTNPPQLPDPLPEFTLDALCQPGRKLGNLVIRLGTGVFDTRYEPFRSAADHLGFSAQEPGQHAYGLPRALRGCLAEGLVILGEQFRGLGVGGTIPWRAGIYPWEALAAGAPAQNPGFLPLRLFRLKNGTSPRERAAYARILERFETLAPGRSFDVTFAPARIPVPAPAPIGAGLVAVPGGTGDGGEQGQAGSNITVVAKDIFGAGGQSSERPIQLFGSGTWEALVLAEALASSEDRFSVLDEPATSLHPTWQGRLQAELRQTAGQVLVVTHSPNLVGMDTPEDLRRLVRIDNPDGASRPHRLPPNLTEAQASKLTRIFSLSADARSLLFCRGAVLVSGETELGAMPTWCSKSQVAKDRGAPQDLDIAFYSVGGDAGFGTVIGALHAFGIPWALVCDGQSFDVEEHWGTHVFRQIHAAGIDVADLNGFTEKGNSAETPRPMTQELWEEQLGLAGPLGVFTLATSWSGAGESFEGFVERVAPGKLAEAGAEVGTTSKIRKGRWVAQGTDCPAEVSDLYKRLLESLIGEPR